MAQPLREFSLLDGVTYGPVQSRRFGASLGINILPFGVKVCSFNCVYCQCGWSGRAGVAAFPPAGEVGGALRRKLAELKASGARLDCMTLSGNGEPTLHPDFPNVVRSILAARDAAGGGIPLHVFSNGMSLDRPGVVEGLNMADERFMKLDAGDVNAPLTAVRRGDILEGLGRLRDFVVQSMFIRGRHDNAGDAAVEAWIDAVGRVKPKAVHVYSLDRVPADREVLPVDRGRLEAIAGRLRERTGIPADVF